MAPELRNCSICGRLFAYQPGGRTVCSRCRDQEEEKYMVVRRYVRDHPGATVFEVAEATGVDEELILQFLREGRLQSRGFVEVVQCQRCGTYIESGKYCAKCLQELDSQFKQVISTNRPNKPDTQEKRSSRERMHIKD
ncbi:MAG TPA: MerR family transcriptional regulator [Syntrophomonadaceae bacterium]|nr:MerR family transcriptional regulator [Syntrophomonadaceae bacterium]HOQ10643.1 MerR family transcriptional regulator [Syntrophomonadaceae bacterium]HPU49819.1 MerR family transcriptional regulator [Syntrophomonadaceae bacterium]